MKVIDNSNLLTSAQISALNVCASLNFNLGKYTSLDDMLAKLKVKVIIEPGIKIFSAPASLFDDMLEEVEREIRDLENMDMHERRYNGWGTQIEKAYAKKEEIEQNKEYLSCMTVRGLYSPVEKVIKLYPEEMAQEYGGTMMAELLVSTLAHETMHAYFDRGVRSKLPYVLFVEEPLAAFGMLLYLHETGNAKYYQWAYDDVDNKYTCYRFGAKLMAQHLREGAPYPTRQYLEDYKIKLDEHDMLDISLDMNGKKVITMPTKGNGSAHVTINGSTLSAKWKDVFQVAPRYFWDSATKTLGLDGNWGKREPLSRIFGLHHVHLFVDLYVDSDEIQNIYLGSHFFADCHGHFNRNLGSVNVIVSPYHKKFTSINGILFDKKSNMPALPRCGNGYYELCRNGKWGVIDANLNPVVPFKYDCVWHFDDNDLIMVRDGHMYGCVNKQGQEQIPLIYEYINDCDDGTYEVKKNVSEYKIDKYGNRI